MTSDSARSQRRGARVGLILGVLAGVALTVIGVRFMVWPEAASRFFGVGSRPEGAALHSVIGIRDLWLGLLAVAFAMLRDYRALGLWLGLGSIVCLADASVVIGAAGKPAAIAFHVVSGVFCGVGAALCWRASRPPTPK